MLFLSCPTPPPCEGCSLTPPQLPRQLGLQQMPRMLDCICSHVSIHLPCLFWHAHLQIARISQTCFYVEQRILCWIIVVRFVVTSGEIQRDLLTLPWHGYYLILGIFNSYTCFIFSFFLNCFIIASHTILPFKVYNSMIFYIFTQLWNCETIITINFRTF